MSYKTDILARNPIAYWKLEEETSENLGSYNPIGTSANWVSSSGYDFSTYGIDGVDSMAFLDDSTYIDFGHLNLTTSHLDTSFSLEFWFNFNYSSSKNRRIPLIWKDFDLNGSYSNQTGYGFAVFAIPLDDSVFLEIYLFDDTNTPAFYTNIPKKEDFDWYQLTLTSQIVNAGDAYVHKLYLDNIKISTILIPIKQTLPQFGNDSIFCNRTNHNSGFATGQFFGYIDEVSIYDYAIPESVVTSTSRPTVPMTFEFTPTVAAYLEHFIVDGIHHEFLPDSFVAVGGDFGVMTNSYPTLDLKRIVVSCGNPRELAGQTNKRKSFRQAWEAGWAGPEHGSYVDIWMRDQLFSLFTTQRSFWLQYDSEMHRVSAYLHQVGSNYKVYYTPTYPIIPYGYDPLHNRVRDHRNHLFVNGVLYTEPFTVDEETGAVVFETSLTASDEVTMNYMWRARVRIKEFSLEPMADAPEAYIGNIIFEQVEFDVTDDPWLITLPRTNNRFYSLGPTNESCAVGESAPASSPSVGSMPSSWTSDGTIGVSIGTILGSVTSDGSYPSQGTYDSGLHTFRNYKGLNVYVGGTIPEVPWYIDKASEMAIKGCDDSLREDAGIFPITNKIYNNLSGANKDGYFEFETALMYFYVANNLSDISPERTVVGVQFDVQYFIKDFRIDDSQFPGQTLEVFSVKDAWVVPVIGGTALLDGPHNKAQSLSVSRIVTTPIQPYYENYAMTTVSYGGLGQLWGREWDMEEIKGLFGVAIKLRIRAHGEFFHPSTYNSMANRAIPVIWCNQYKVYYV